MTAREGEQRPVKPVYLSGVLTVEAELSAGACTTARRTRKTPRVSSSRWSSSAGRRCCSRRTRATQGSAFRDPIPPPSDDAAGKLARSRQQSRLIPPLRQRRMPRWLSLNTVTTRPPASVKGDPVIAMMTAGVVTVPLAEIADEDGTPRSHLMNQANRAFDNAEGAQRRQFSRLQPYPKDAHRHLG